MSENFLLGWGPNAVEIESAFRAGLLQRIKDRFPAIERRKGLSLEEFHSQYRAKRAPIILEGAVASWPAIGKWTFDYLATECGDVPVVIDHYSAERTTKATFGEFVQRVKQNTGPEAQPLYLQEWHFHKTCPSLVRDLGPLDIASYNFLPRMYGPDAAVRALWVGQKGAVTRLHQDAYFNDTIHAQIVGRKDWCLFGPDAFLPTKANKPDWDALFENPSAPIMHCTLAPGDLLYLPARWWHRVSLLTDSIGIGMPALDEHHLYDHMKSKHQELLPLILNAEHIKQTQPDLYQITLTRLAIHAKRFDIDLTRIR